jgi:hypothetical protein
VANDLRADLDEFLLQARQRPVLDRFGRRQRAQEVSEIVSERMQLKANDWSRYDEWQSAATASGAVTASGIAGRADDESRLCSKPHNTPVKSPVPGHLPDGFEAQRRRLAGSPCPRAIR